MKQQTPGEHWEYLGLQTHTKQGHNIHTYFWGSGKELMKHSFLILSYSIPFKYCFSPPHIILLLILWLDTRHLEMKAVGLIEDFS